MKEIESLKNIAPYVYRPFLALAIVKDGYLQGPYIEENNEPWVLVIRFVLSLIIVSFVFSGTLLLDSRVLCDE